MKIYIPVLLNALFLSGCLDTRSAVKEQEEKLVLRKQLSTLQQTTADTSSRFQEIDEDTRKIVGRLESVEQRMHQNAQKAERNDQALEMRAKQTDDKLNVIKEDLVKLAAEVTDLKNQIAQMNAAVQQALAHPPAPVPAASGKDAKAKKKSESFDQAQALFEKKNFQDAIFKYEEYRKQFPNGRNFAMATYRIGLSFEELGMKDEATGFYEELVAKFPKSKEAERAQGRLKKLKKRG